jgi:exosortase D (VPLPA-CTERM-specific)
MDVTAAKGTPHPEVQTYVNAPWGYAVLWIALAVVGGVAFFWDGITSLLDAWSRPEYSHGPLIPIIAGYLLLREMRNRPASAAPGSHVPGLAVMALGLVVGLLGNLTQIPYFITYGLIIVVGGLILLVAGAKRGIHFWVAWVYLLFMLPLPTAMYWQLSGELQFISSRLGVEFIQTIGIPAFLDGNIIDLGIYKLQVAEACSGLRYLFPLMSFGFLFATLYRGPLWHKIVLFLSSLPITVLMNSLRIGVIGVLVNSYGTAQAEGFLHWFEGWIIFVACIILLYIEAILLQRLAAKPQSVLGILDLDFGGTFPRLQSAGNISASRSLIAAVLLLLFSGALWQLLPARPAPFIDRETLASFPMVIDGWKGQLGPKLDPTIEKVLGADDYLSVDYIAADERAPVNLFISFYNSTTDGTGIHSPEVCIPGGGWEVSNWRQVQVSTGDAAIQPFTVNRATIQKGLKKQLVYYWFDMRGRRFSSEYKAKIYTVWDSLTRSRADGALIRFVTSIEADESEAAGDERLAAFLASVMKIIPDYVPE